MGSMRFENVNPPRRIKLENEKRELSPFYPFYHFIVPILFILLPCILLL
jgi:hypothetical protein